MSIPLTGPLAAHKRRKEIEAEDAAIKAADEARRRKYREEDERRERERAERRAERERAEHDRAAEQRAARRAAVERDLYRAGLDAVAVRSAADAAMAALDVELAETIATEGDRLLAGAAVDIRRGRRPGEAPGPAFGDLA